ncbi:hypothetical protein SO694_00143016 [Aureococcus anophagefferens]|uniref:TFIIS N-terminal domain-containing protein n=1 Tax=Aureococcus anophagefferens TaxID=44056 RepID=A0ABR1FPL5_AURAN
MAPPAAQPSLDEVCSKLGAKSRAIKDVCDWAEARRPRVPVFFARVRAAARARARARRATGSFAPQARCGAVDGGAGGELLAALFRTIKHDEAGGERAENVREAVMFALHEVLMKNDAAARAKVADLRDQASRVIERRLVKSAENLTKVARAWRQKFECFGSSDKLRMTHKILRQLGKEADKLEGERTRPEKRKADEAKAPEPKKPKAEAKAAKPAMNEPGEVEVYVAHLADDEAAAVAMAAVHLAGKATDAPTRLSHVFEAVRSPQGGSMAKRCWPLAAPWRDQVLLAEQRLLRCLNYDVRTEKVKKVLADLCAVMEDERYPTWAGTGAAAGMAPPILGAKVDLERANDELKAYFTPDLQSNRKDAKADPWAVAAARCAPRGAGAPAATRGDQRPYGGAPPPPPRRRRAAAARRRATPRAPPFGRAFARAAAALRAPHGAFPPRGHAPPPRGAFPPPYHAPGPYGPGGPAPPPPPPRPRTPARFPPHHHPRPYGGRNGGRDELGFPANRHANGDRGPRPDREDRDRRGGRDRAAAATATEPGGSGAGAATSGSGAGAASGASAAGPGAATGAARAGARVGPGGAALAKMEKLRRRRRRDGGARGPLRAVGARAGARARGARAGPLRAVGAAGPLRALSRARRRARQVGADAGRQAPRATRAPVKQSARASAVKAEQPAPESDDDVPISRLPARSSSAAPAPAPDSDDDVPISALRAPAPATASPPRRGGKASKPDKGHVPAKKKPAGRKPSGRKRKAD